MPVFEKDGKRILYIHVPKTAGSSVLDLFDSNGFETSYLSWQAAELYQGLCSPQHIHGELIEREFELSSFDYIFSVFRDPVDRLISEYTWRCASLGERHKDFKSWAYQTLETYNSNPYINDNHIRPQSEFYVMGCEVFDFSTIRSLPNYLTAKIGLDLGESATMTSKNSSKYPYKLGWLCKRQIRKFYQADYAWHKENRLNCYKL